MRKSKKEPSDLDLMRRAVDAYRRANPNARMVRPSVNVSQVVNVSDMGRFVVLKDHTGGAAMPTYPVLGVYQVKGKRLVSCPGFIC